MPFHHFSQPVTSEPLVAPLNISRDGGSHAMGGDGYLYVAGGSPIFGEDASDTYVGTTFENILRLDLKTAQWECLECFGDIPRPRHHHTLVYFRGSIILCGGEVLPNEDRCLDTVPTFASSCNGQTSCTPWQGYGVGALRSGTIRLPSSFSPYSTASAGRMPTYVLDLKNRCWHRCIGEGEFPLNRSHHACCVVGTNMLLLGGKPVLKKWTGPTGPKEEMLTNKSMLDLQQEGFYDAYILHLGPMVWQRMRTSSQDPMRSPHLWGHVMVHCGDSTVVVLGGMDVGLSGNIATVHEDSNEDAPEAMLSTAAYILDTRTFLWDRVPTGYDGPAQVASNSPDAALISNSLVRMGGDTPTPCVDLTAVPIPNSDEILVMGGWGFPSYSETQSEPVLLQPNSDVFVFNTTHRQWRRVPCPSKQLFGGHVVCCVYASHIMIAKTHDSMIGLDCNVRPRTQGWQVFKSDLALSFETDRIRELEKCRNSGGKGQFESPTSLKLRLIESISDDDTVSFEEERIQLATSDSEALREKRGLQYSKSERKNNGGLFVQRKSKECDQKEEQGADFHTKLSSPHNGGGWARWPFGDRPSEASGGRAGSGSHEGDAVIDYSPFKENYRSVNLLKQIQTKSLDADYYVKPPPKADRRSGRNTSPFGSIRYARECSSASSVSLSSVGEVSGSNFAKERGTDNKYEQIRRVSPVSVQNENGKRSSSRDRNKTGFDKLKGSKHDGSYGDLRTQSTKHFDEQPHYNSGPLSKGLIQENNTTAVYSDAALVSDNRSSLSKAGYNGAALVVSKRERLQQLYDRLEMMVEEKGDAAPDELLRTLEEMRSEMRELRRREAIVEEARRLVRASWRSPSHAE